MVMWVSILAMTEYDPDIWNYFTVPDIINKDTAIDKIIADCAELELLYSDPDMLKILIKNWTQTELHIWQKLADTLDLDYNPIYNLDVTYEETRSPNLLRTRVPNLTEKRSPELVEKTIPDLQERRAPNITTDERPADTTTESVAGYNSDTFSPARKTERGGFITTTETGSDTVTTTGNETKSQSGNETIRKSGTEVESETGNERTTIRRYGNQGVTMSQDMIQKERDIDSFSLYDYITRSFKNRFCLMIY